MSSPTLSQYGDFQAAFEHFNLELFGGSLPDTMLTLARTRHASGYVIPDGFHTRTDEAGSRIPELGLNPRRFANRTAEEVLGALACEMVKLAQHADGTGSPDGYLNKDFYRRCYAIQLDPTTGRALDNQGAFAQAALHLLAQGWKVNYVAPQVAEKTAKREAGKRSSKTKYTCPVTGANAWAKPGSVLFTAEGAAQSLPMVAQGEG